MVTTVKIENIREGYFRMPKGKQVYLRISDGSARYNNLDSSCIHGITANGNMTNVPRYKYVVPMHGYEDDVMDQSIKKYKRLNKHQIAIINSIKPLDTAPIEKSLKDLNSIQEAAIDDPNIGHANSNIFYAIIEQQKILLSLIEELYHDNS